MYLARGSCGKSPIYWRICRPHLASSGLSLLILALSLKCFSLLVAYCQRRFSLDHPFQLFCIRCAQWIAWSPFEYSKSFNQDVIYWIAYRCLQFQSSHGHGKAAQTQPGDPIYRAFSALISVCAVILNLSRWACCFQLSQLEEEFTRCLTTRYWGYACSPRSDQNQFRRARSVINSVVHWLNHCEQEQGRLLDRLAEYSPTSCLYLWRSNHKSPQLFLSYKACCQRKLWKFATFWTRLTIILLWICQLLSGA